MIRFAFVICIVLVLAILQWYVNFSTVQSYSSRVLYGTLIQKATTNNSKKHTGVRALDGLNPSEATTKKHRCVSARERLNPSLLPSHSNDSALYPDPSHPWDDRIIAQLSYIPKVRPNVTKTIFLPYKSHRHARCVWSEERFRLAGCKVTQCVVTDNVSLALTADLVVLPEPGTPIIWQAVGKVLNTNRKQRADQIWAAHQEESPIHSPVRQSPYKKRVFNWTMAFSPWSTVPMPYGELYPITPGVTTLPQTRNYATNKTASIVWFTSNCNASNKRTDYVTELSKYINVDIYGKCNNNALPCKDKGYLLDYMGPCMRDAVSRYKFYLAFENSNCDTYVTEKFSNTSLTLDILPIVMGALPSYYAHMSPPHSYIHVEDYASPAALARYLHTLASNDTLYNSYFRWKGAWKTLTKEEMDNGLMCRLCAMIHAPRRTVTNTHKQWYKSEHCRGPVFNATLN